MRTWSPRAPVRRRASPSPDLVSAQDVACAYRVYLGREPHPTEVAARVAHTGTLRELLSQLLDSAEHQKRLERLVRLESRAFAEDLRLLHDTLAGTALADRYWVWGGLLLGWARHGGPLAHDQQDADFCLLAEDVWRLRAAAPALTAAGFAPALRFVANDGAPTQYSWTREGAKYEFFVMEPLNGRLSYRVYTDGSFGAPATQARGAVARQPLTSFQLVGRAWRKHADHEAELTAIYGDWRSPVPHWQYLDDLALVEREPWLHADHIAWAGDFDAPAADLA